MSRELHWATVTNNYAGIPSMRGAIRVTCESLLPSGQELPEDIYPIFDLAGDGWGMFFVPLSGSTVRLEVVPGRDSVSFADVRYRAMVYSAIEDIPPELKINYPFRWGIKTPKGHLIFFDNLDGSAFLKIPTIMTIDAGEAIYVQLTNGNKIRIESDNITMEHKNGNIIKIEDDNITLEGEGAKIELKGSGDIYLNEGSDKNARKGDHVMTGAGPLPIIEGADHVWS